MSNTTELPDRAEVPSNDELIEIGQRVRGIETSDGGGYFLPITFGREVARAVLARLAQHAESGKEEFAWAVFAENGNVIIWSKNRAQVDSASKEYGRPIVPVIGLSAAQQAAPCPYCGGKDGQHDRAYPHPRDPQQAAAPADCSGTPSSCPDNEGYGCHCSAPGTPEAPKPPFPISDDEMIALRRFWECATDGEGYDVEKAMMQRLAEMGLVQRKSGAYYMATEFGLYVLGEYTVERSAQLDGGQEGSDHA